MAINEECYKCGKMFTTSACSGSICCDDCNGVNEAKAAELERWARLSDHDKLNELYHRVKALENHDCNPLIG